MAEETKNISFGPQYYQFGQDEPPVQTAHVDEEGLTGIDSERYGKTPDNPKNAREVVERGVVNVANPKYDSPSTTANGNLDAAGSDRKIKTLQDIISSLDKPETSEQRKKRERREKSARIVSAISDGLQAMGNLFFTSRYAPNAYNHEKGSQLKAQNAAIEAARKDRESNADQYQHFTLALGDAENERAKTVREIEAEQERRKLAREKAERDAEAHGWLAALQSDKQREQAGKAATAEQKALTAQAEADNAPALQQAKLAKEREIAASYSRANKAEYTTAYDEMGRPHPFRTAAEAEVYARQHGTWHEEEYEETTDTHTENNWDNSVSTTTTKKKRGYSKKPGNKGAGYGDGGKGAGYGGN